MVPRALDLWISRERADRKVEGKPEENNVSGNRKFKRKSEWLLSTQVVHTLEGLRLHDSIPPTNTEMEG